MESKQWYNSKDKLPKQGQNIIPKINGREYPAIIFEGRMSEKFEAENIQWCELVESSPTPQVQSGLSAEEVLKQHIPVIFEAMKGLVVPAMEEYAASKVAEEKFKNEELREQVNDLEDNLEKEQKASSEWARLAVEAGNQRSRYQSKVAEKEREIERLSGLLKEQHIKNVINIHQDKPEREWLANSSWRIYRELHNIQQPDKI